MAACYALSHSGGGSSYDDDDDDEEEESSSRSYDDDGYYYYWEDDDDMYDDDEYDEDDNDCCDGDNTVDRDDIEKEVNEEWYQFVMEVMQCVEKDIKEMEDKGAKLYAIFWDSRFAQLTLIYTGKDGLPIKNVLEFDPNICDDDGNVNTNTGYYNPYAR
jgi:hypothetical protein